MQLDLGQRLIPEAHRGTANSFHIPCWSLFLYILACLFGADERDAYLRLNDLTSVGLKVEGESERLVLTHCGFFGRCERAAGPRPRCCGVGIEHHVKRDAVLAAFIPATGIAADTLRFMIGEQTHFPTEKALRLRAGSLVETVGQVNRKM